MTIVLHGYGDFEEWRHAARHLLRHGVKPWQVDWGGRSGGLFDTAPVETGRRDRPLSVPRVFVELAESLVCHSDPARFDLAYRLLWRLQGEPRLIEMPTDPDMAKAHRMVKSVHRDSHKMTAFMRFKAVSSRNARRAFVAWFEPDHFVVARTAPFFQRRFTDMDWLIATPRGSSSWDGEHLRFDAAPAVKPALDDETDDLWRTYYASIFNPARLKVKMMQSEMPKKYWRNLPEADLIPQLIEGAEGRVRTMAEAAPAEPPRFHRRLQGRVQGGCLGDLGE
jgi:DNA polymerase